MCPREQCLRGRGNDVRGTATPLQFDDELADHGLHLAFGIGSLDPSAGGQSWQDENWWSFEAQAGDRVAIAVDTPGLTQEELDPWVRLYYEDAPNSLTQDSDGGPEWDAYISGQELPSDGIYYVQVFRHREQKSGNYQLRVELARGIDLESDANYHNDTIARRG